MVEQNQAATIECTVRNEASTAGWVAVIIAAGFRVRWRPVHFGQTRYTVRAGDDFVVFDQAPTRGRKARFNNPTEGQQRIVEALKLARVVV